MILADFLFTLHNINGFFLCFGRFAKGTPHILLMCMHKMRFFHGHLPRNEPFFKKILAIFQK